MNTRGAMVVVAALVALAATAGTGAFSATTADRQVQIDVVDDASAYLGVSLNASNATNGTTTLDVTVHNQFPENTTLTDVTVSTGNATIELADSDPLESGESATGTFENATCGETVVVNATGPSVAVQLNRTIDC